MLSDDSSSDSETGRFKGKSEKPDEFSKNSKHNSESFRARERNNPPNNDRFNRGFERKRHERDYYDRIPRDKSRHSPINRRRNSRERSPYKRHSQDRYRHKDSRDISKSKYRSNSKDRRRHSRSRSLKSSERKRDLKEEIKNIVGSKVSTEKCKEIKHSPEANTKHSSEFLKKARKSSISPDVKVKQSEESAKKSREIYSPDNKTKRSEIHKPEHTQVRKSKSPDTIPDTRLEKVQEGSYYNLVPTIVKEVSEESSEIDSSDDERLRAKLLNLEKELHKSQKKKHKKKSKKKHSKPDKDNDVEITSVEVSSTTDVQNKSVPESPKSQTDITEVTSTQKNKEKESSEEGEILSDDNSQDLTDIDPTDLRHKLLSRSRAPRSTSPDLRERLKHRADVCGPALPPHLETYFRESESCDIEGPALPPRLQKNPRNIGPSIPTDLRKVLAESSREVIKYESSDDDDGIGPLPVGAEDRWSKAHQHLEERALDMKIKKLDGYSMQKSNIKSREKWMLELPEGKAKILGLEARTFRAKEGPDMSDRSSWTDTPDEKARKAAGLQRVEDADVTLKKEAKARAIANRDEDQEKAVKKHKKKHKREESLLEMHQKKLKKKKKKEEKDNEKKERRPFSRDVDLDVNRFDEAQKKSIIKKAQDLNTRFSRGESKFL